MNAIKNIVLAAAVLSAAPAMAGIFTFTSSENLAGQYDVYDSGEQTYDSTNYFDYRNYQTVTTATILNTFQDMATTQWYQTTQYTSTYSYDYSAQDYANYYQTGYVQFPQVSAARAVQGGIASINPVAGDQWIELSLTNTTGRTLSYQASTSGTSGTKTSPRGNVQYISPAFAVTSDGVAAPTSFYKSGPTDYNFYSYGSTNSEVSVVAEATDGGTLSFMQIYLSESTAIGAVRTERVSYVSGQWTQDVAISAPVPEPETYAMLLAGLGLMGAVARRRRQAANA